MEEMESERVRSNLSSVWVAMRLTITARIGAIEAALAGLGKGGVGRAEIEAALAAAHKLAGVLGTFGLHRGSEVAAEIESRLEAADPSTNLGALRDLVGELKEIVEGAEVEG
jgi:HPt (histidine-containing phosphotransfer) domain-containing protein